jgi:hypothetical protein
VLYHYVIVRADLPLGVQIAQTIHAAGESAKLLVEPLPPRTRAVGLHVPNEAALIELEMKLGENGFEFKSIREPDAPWDGALMAIGLKPQERTNELKGILQSLKLAA